LKRWLALPLKRLLKLKPPSRWFLIYKKTGGLAKMQNQIKQISDLERLISKLQLESFASRSSLFKESLDAIIP
jgi:DNA mismatch repair protein MutS